MSCRKEPLCEYVNVQILTYDFPVDIYVNGAHVAYLTEYKPVTMTLRPNKEYVISVIGKKSHVIEYKTSSTDCYEVIDLK